MFYQNNAIYSRQQRCFIRIMLSTVESSDALIRIMLSTVESSDALIRIMLSTVQRSDVY